jgi:hypothetical protein
MSTKVANIRRGGGRSPCFFELTSLGDGKLAVNVDYVQYAERVHDVHAPRTILWLIGMGERIEVKEDLHELFRKPVTI